LINEVEGVQGRYGASFEEDGPATVEIKTEVAGPWLRVTSRADYEGATWDHSTDRLSGDPYSAHVFNDWVGEAKSAPSVVSDLEDLNKWALLHTMYERQYTDVGSWGVHVGRWIDSISPDGIVTLKVQSSRRFQDVSPVAETTSEQIDLSLFSDISFDGLIQLLKDENEFVRELSAKLLGILGDSRAVDALLIQATEDVSNYVQKEAILALGAFGGDRAIEGLIGLLLEKDNRTHWADLSLVEFGEPALDSLFPLIKDDDERVSIRVVRMIGRIGGEKSLDYLIQTIEDERASIRAQAVLALGRSGNARAVDHLIGLLEDESKEVQQRTVRALSELGDKRAVDPLTQYLLAEDKGVRRYAAEALSHLGWKPSNPEETAWHLFAGQEWKKLAAMGESAADTIIKVLQDEDGSSILEPLREAKTSFTDPRAIEPLLDIYSGRDEIDYKRREAIWALGRLKLPQVIRPILEIFLSVERDYLRKAALKSLEDLASSGLAVSDELVPMLKGKRVVKSAYEELQNVFTILAAVPISLEQIKTITPLLKSVVKRDIDKETTATASGLLELSSLITSLSKGDEPTRVLSAEKLGKIGLPSATTALIDALEDRYPPVRTVAAAALGKLGEGAISPLMDALSSKIDIVRIGAAEALGLIRDGRAAEGLLKSLKDKHRIVRQNAAWALGNLYLHRSEFDPIRGKIIRAVAKAVTKDDYYPVRFNAVYSLARISDKRVVKPLLEALFAPEAELRLNASYGFNKNAGLFRNPESKLQKSVVDKLIMALADGYDRVRYNAADALRLIGGEKALLAMKALLTDDDKYMRELAARGVKEIKSMLGKRRSSWSFSSRYVYELRNPDEIEELIQTLLDDDDAVQRSAQVALGEMGSIALSRMMEALQDKEGPSQIREGAAAALGRIGDKRAVEALMIAIEDEVQEVRCNAAWSLAELVDKRSVKALIKATSDEFWLVRLNAVAGLGKIRGKAAFEALLKMLNDEHPRVREIATSFLARFKSPRVIPALEKQLKDEDPGVRKYAKEWLDHLKKKSK
jgi:HEAT repeat protein